MSQPNALETLMLELINEERSAAGLSPLRFNGDLNEASEDHSEWMLEKDIFSHTGENGSSAGDRIQSAGYELEGNWTWGENIAWQSEQGDPGLEDDVRDLHESLMESPGHRANILNPDYDEIGIGIEQGDFGRFDSVMVTQNFGATDATSEPDTPVTPEPDTPVVETDPDTPTTPVSDPETDDPVEVPTSPDTPTTPPTLTELLEDFFDTFSSSPISEDFFTDLFMFVPQPMPTPTDPDTPSDVPSYDEFYEYTCAPIQSDGLEFI
ncbi:CAP domain-containing protein [Roseovarius sp. 2305UL8-3]|uniref:CAP domain-containing protein n=1 Tax=Roseovarius conchicola TaxID=3121636 RepID=UPI0035283532